CIVTENAIRKGTAVTMNELNPSLTADAERPVLRSIDGLAAPAVEVSQLRKTYPGGVEAVRDIDFDVAPGEVFGLLGPNGAGKSTTIGMLSTAVRPSAGSARLGGFDVAAEPLAARAVSSVVFQEPVVDRGIAGLRSRAELTVLLTTHYLDEAQRLCDRVAIMHLGSIVALDTPQALLAGLGAELLEMRVGGDPEGTLRLLREEGVAGADAFAV